LDHAAARRRKKQDRPGDVAAATVPDFDRRPRPIGCRCRAMSARLVPVALVALVTACAEPPPEVPASAAEPSDDAEDGHAYEPWSPKPDGALGGPIDFAAACAPGPRTTIAAVGDVLLHGALQRQAIDLRDDGRFTTLWAPVADLLAQADTTYANLEGPTARGVNRGGHDVPDPGLAWDDIVYSSYPQFNYHGSLEDDLLASGVDVVSTANNHAMDRRALGADRTIERLEESGLRYTGTRHRDDLDAPWYTITEAAGFKLAWLACSYSTNGLPDDSHQVLGCWSDDDAIVDLIGELRGTAGIDAVIVTPHWGVEYTANPTDEQRELAHRFLDAGATFVLGSHPHVLEPWERYQTADGRDTFVIYSLGNFVSGQAQLARRSTILLYLGLTRTDAGVVPSGVRYLPLVMNQRDGVRAVEAIDRAGGSSDSRALTVAMFGSVNLQAPDAPLVMTPACD
jgi:poly-gamma-glutamate synthesis protein (capsule biosynthesis protein)